MRVLLALPARGAAVVTSRIYRSVRKRPPPPRPFETTTRSNKFNAHTALCVFEKKSFCQPWQQWQSRGRESKDLETNDKKATDNWDIFINQSGRMRERDCAKYWSNLSLHRNISRKDRNIIMDRMRTTQDQCTKAFYDKKTNRMERITENNPTPLL